MEKIERNMKQFTATKTVKAISMTRTETQVRNRSSMAL